MENKTYKVNKTVAYSCIYCVVWCSKYRRKVIVGEVEKRLKELMNEVASQLNVEIFEIKTMPDSIQLLLQVNPQFGIHKTIKRLKGISSRILRSEFKQLTTKLPTLWTNNYFVSTVGNIPHSTIEEYIENQEIS